MKSLPACLPQSSVSKDGSILGFAILVGLRKLLLNNNLEPFRLVRKRPITPVRSGVRVPYRPFRYRLKLLCLAWELFFRT